MRECQDVFLSLSEGHSVCQLSDSVASSGRSSVMPSGTGAPVCRFNFLAVFKLQSSMGGGQRSRWAGPSVMSVLFVTVLILTALFSTFTAFPPHSPLQDTSDCTTTFKPRLRRVGPLSCPRHVFMYHDTHGDRNKPPHGLRFLLSVHQSQAPKHSSV